MDLTIHNRTLLRSWLASAALFAAVSACSRSDRAETGSSQDQPGAAATTADTAAVAATQGTDTAVSQADSNLERQPVAQGTPDKNAQSSASSAPDTAVGYQPMEHDTATASSSDTASTEMAGAAEQPAGDSGDGAGDTVVVVGDSTEMGKSGERVEPTESSQQANADTLNGETDSDRVRPPEDSTETLGSVTTGDSMAVSDTGAGSAEMTRDTSTSVAQGDTVAQVQVDSTTQVADTSTQVAADTGAAIQVQVDTTTMDQRAEVAASAEANADTLATETDRVRPAEDSTDVLGVNEENAEAAPDQTPAGAAGAQISGEMVTGAEAVAQVTREGQRCTVVDNEESNDLASSPATMNPCGTGTMTLPRIQTEK